jgi:opacity protein-like surface antigen
MKRFDLLLSAAALSMLLASPAYAQDERPWSVSFDLGGQAAASGDVHAGGSGRVLTLPTEVSAKSYGDIYGTGFYWAAGLGYRLASNGEVRISANYTSNPSERVQVGTVASLPLFGEFGDYKAFGMDFGYRQYLTRSRVQPFVGASAGFTRVDTITSTFSVPAAGVTLPDVPFYESSTVPSFALGGGAQIRLTDRIAVQGGLDFRWHGDLTGEDGLAGTGLEGINDESRRWAVPITAGITFRF